MIVVTDAGPIIHLSLVGLLRLLPALYQHVLVPDLVYKEVAEQLGLTVRGTWGFWSKQSGMERSQRSHPSWPS